MNFHEVRFPAALSVGSTGGPERRTEIVTLSNGFEERNSPWAHSRRRYDAGLGVRSLDDLAEVVAFYDDYGRGMDGMRLSYNSHCFRAAVVERPGEPTTDEDDEPQGPGETEPPTDGPDDGMLLIDFR